ncbi:hypothetical protein BU14_0246s0002 [Porphyra umbilicalis]|uniref:Uncharacterized protein n=1 Tax=Porphyra umbilicalis TaxID=2786 RepID=A0A1X6P3K9_PORUM|nr:hypothetical protein BU14_0246s0002 [Porphyra umbilicalis]|eukprot:OSX75213.1 hypothetical protein BU14_0246s0002 [Porphyra umbilicalis]
MRCDICLYQASAGVAGHQTRNCPIRKVECRHQLPKDDPFYLSGPCRNVYCVHNECCPRCLMIGHTTYTLKLTSMRWKVTTYWRAVPEASDTMPPLDSRDFVCSLVTDRCVRRLLDNVQDLAL